MSERLIILYYLASEGIVVDRVDKYMYLYQKFGFNLQYRFKISVNGVKSKSVQHCMEDEIAKGYLVIKDGILYCSEDGLNLINDIIFSADELDSIDDLYEVLTELSLQDLEMLVAIDIIMSDEDKQGGVDALVKNRETIENLVGNVCSSYTPSKFVYLVGFLSNLESIMNK